MNNIVRLPSTVLETHETPITEDWESVLDRVRRAMADAEYVKVDPARLRPMEGQPREYFDETDLIELSQSIVRVGQFQPGIIRAVKPVGAIDLEILDGERRWRGVIIGRVPIYKAMQVQIDDEAAPFVVASIANFNRAGHTPMEISNAIERLHSRLKMPIAVIAKMYRITEFWAYQLHGLQKLHPKVRGLLDPHLVAREQLPITAAIQVSKLQPSVQEELVTRFRAGGVTLKGLRKEALTIARETGTYIRERETNQPARKLRSVDHLSGALLRTATDLFTQVSETGMEQILRQNPAITHRALTAIRRADAVVKNTLAALGDPARTAPVQDVKNTAKGFLEHRAATIEKPRVEPPPKPVPAPAVVAPKQPQAVVRPSPTAPPPQAAPAPKLPDTRPDWQKKREINVRYDSGARIVMSPVPLEKFVRLWNEGLLEFQQKRQPKPAWLPTHDEVAVFLEKK
jgi:ParB/RepB/Spo0J family partition protein